ncbi:MAG TPA: PilZ domain-containing protein [Oligoflexia bacterium]|mgnify:CR=1 FL=1|nr:PilZ domain-containing protein [Oligoflexia bacterium]HMR24592.1 PilZ domain-containing protein [Oligoflexia bacterium]
MFTHEKRLSRRFPSKIGVYTKDAKGLNFGMIRDLSRSGAYIETNNLKNVGMDYHFVFSNGVISAPVTAKIIRVKDSLFEGGQSGLAVDFSEKLSPMAKRLRDDLILYLMNEKHQSMWQTSSANVQIKKLVL